MCIICCHLYKEKNECVFVNLFIHRKALRGYTRKIAVVVSQEGNWDSREQKGRGRLFPIWSIIHFKGFFCVYLFIYFWLRWVFIAVRGLSLIAARGATLHCGVWASHCGGLSCCGSWALGAGASVVVACGLNSCGSRALERRLSSCGAWA